MSFTGLLPKQSSSGRVAVVAIALALIIALAAADLGASDDVPGQMAAQGAGEPLQEEQDGDADENLPYLFAAYIITWAGFFAYVFVVSRRQREMQRELEALKQALADREEQAPDVEGS